MITTIRSFAIALILSAVLHQSVRAASYVGIDLYKLQAPAGLPNFSALDAFGGQVGGRAAPLLSDNFHAILWSAPSGQPIDLTPAGVAVARVTGLITGQQVGSFTPEVSIGTFGPHAAIWLGTPASLIDLNPPGDLVTSVALATDGSREVGYVNAPSPARVPHAALWSGTAASVVDLHPPAYSQSQANAVRDGEQAGQAATGTGNHAILWTGTAASAIDLNPAGADGSFALGVGGGQQVGVANFPSFSSHAALWSGNATSFIDLTPVGSSNTVLSEALDVRGGIQVGFVQVGMFDHAYLWTGSAASAIDLQLILSAALESSRALSIDEAGNIFGTASDTSGHLHAVEWSPVPEPSTFVLLLVGMMLLWWDRGRSALGNALPTASLRTTPRTSATRRAQFPPTATVLRRPNKA